MQRRSLVMLVVITLLAGLIAACGESSDGQQTAVPRRGIISPSAASSATPNLNSDTNTALELQVTPQMTSAAPGTPERATVSVWWPNELFPQNDTAAQTILDSQVELFRLTYASYAVDLRRKRTSGLGGILPTLRAAAPVAPGALPDLTLMRRSDMITAAREGLIVPLDEWVPADLAGANLLPGTRVLGEVDGALYGVPYALVLYHSVYRASMFDDPPLAFADVLDAGAPYVFAGGETPVSWTVLLQYIAAGGQLVDQDGSAALNPDALLAVLNYYAQGRESDVFDPGLLEYTSHSDFWNAFVTGDAHIASIDSRTYLSEKDTVQNVGLAPLPTPNGLALTMLDGWMWVVTTHNPDRQQRALAFLAWMMRVGQQSAFSEAFGIVPSQSRALQLWEDEVYADFIETLIETAVVFPEARRNNAAAAALQTALSAVLRGASPEVAANEALSVLGS